VLNFAGEVLNNRGDVSEATVAAARQAGITDEQFLEIVAAVAVNIFTNYTLRFTQDEVDFPAVDQLSHRRSQICPLRVSDL
jgi:alkylhydroperoxidase family enzyme